MEALVSSTGAQPTVTVLDNRDRKHTIALDAEGTVFEHRTTAYPETPGDRTPVENELVRQARRYARYTLTVEEDAMLALPPAENPDLLYTASRLMHDVSDEQFDELFAALGVELAGRTTDEVDPVQPLPRHVDDDAFLFYRADLWMTQSEDFTLEDYQQYVAGLDVEMIEGTLNAFVGGDQLSVGLQYVRNIGRIAEEAGPEALNLLDIAGCSSIAPVAIQPDGTEVTPQVDSPVDEPPTARVELPPVDPGSREECRELLAFHLLCRARDASLRMGVEPRRDVCKLQGHGSHDATQTYRELDCYEPYHDPDATVTTWDPRRTTGEGTR
jgi:hypothetical protein